MGYLPLNHIIAYYMFPKTPWFPCIRNANQDHCPYIFPNTPRFSCIRNANLGFYCKWRSKKVKKYVRKQPSQLLPVLASCTPLSCSDMRDRELWWGVGGGSSLQPRKKSKKLSKVPKKLVFLWKKLKKSKKLVPGPACQSSRQEVQTDRARWTRLYIKKKPTKANIA